MDTDDGYEDDILDDEADTFDDDDDSLFNETAEITYSFIGSDAPEDSFEMKFSAAEADLLKEAEDNGEALDTDYISENLQSIHRKILRAIRNDLEEKSEDPHDGMKEVHYPPAYHGWERAYDSHQDLLDAYDEDDVEYEVDIFW